MRSRTRRTKIVATTVCAALAPAGAANGAGGPTFAEARSYGVGEDPTSVAAADFDRDGDQDLAVVNGNAGTVSVLTNRGNGTFAKAAGYRTGRRPISVAAADLGSGKGPDLAVANLGAGTVSVLINTTKQRLPTPKEVRDVFAPKEAR